MSREYQVQFLLGKFSKVPVPKVLVLSQRRLEESLLCPQADFYVMQHVKGVVYQDATLQNVPKRIDRFEIYKSAVETLATLHAVPQTVFSPIKSSAAVIYARDTLKKSLETMSKVIQKQEASSPAVPRIKDLDRILGWLERELIEKGHDNIPASFTHGDFKLDNMVRFKLYEKVELYLIFRFLMVLKCRLCLTGSYVPWDIPSLI